MAQGCLATLGHGVLRVTGAPTTEFTAMWHGVLATRGVLVAGTAAYLWGMIDQPPGAVQLAVAHDRRLIAPSGCQIRRAGLAAGECSRRYGLPVTGRVRSALDHLADSELVEATTFADRAISQGWLGPSDLKRRLQRPLPGNSTLRKVMRTLATGAEAESERRLHRLLRDHCITGWTANHQVRVAGILLARLDIAFVSARIAIEVDGFAYHRDRQRFQRDRTRQNELVNLGWTVLRFTWQDITADPEQVIRTVRVALQRAAAA